MTCADKSWAGECQGGSRRQQSDIEFHLWFPPNAMLARASAANLPHRKGGYNRSRTGIAPHCP
jgi:hypothetical protein